MRHFYYYIPPCPKCGSRRTGRYIRETRNSAMIEESSLRHGEIVRFAMEEPIKNAFCVDCGYTWGCTPELKFWPQSRIQEEIEERTTEEAYIELKEQNDSIRAAKNSGIGKSALRFIFGRDHL